MESPDLFCSNYPRWQDMTQAERVKYWLENIGSITPLEALKELSIHRVDRIIYKLRDKGRGMDIKTIYEYSENGFGQKIKYAKYRLRLDHETPSS